PYEERSAGRGHCSVSQQSSNPQYQRKPVLGIFLQRMRDSAGGRCALSCFWTEIKPYVRSGGNELKQLFRSFQCTAAEIFPCPEETRSRGKRIRAGTDNIRSYTAGTKEK